MNKSKRILFASISIVLIGIFLYIITLIFNDEIDIFLILLSCVIFNILAIFLTENFFTKPSDVIATSISNILLIFPFLKNKENQMFKTIFIIIIIFSIFLLLISSASLLLISKSRSEDHILNKIARFFKNISCMFGKTKWIYTFIFSVLILYYYNDITKNPCLLFIILILLIIINVLDFNKFKPKNKINLNSIGFIKGFEKDGIIVCELYQDKNINVKDIVKYIDLEDNSKINYGIVLEKLTSLNNKVIKIISIFNENNNYIYNLNIGNIYFHDINNEYIDQVKNNMVGIITSGTSIDSIKFRYINMRNEDLKEGDLLEVNIKNKKVYYQLINAIDNIEKLENDNTLGYIIVEAIQIGIFNREKISFERYGWIPNINTIILKSPKNIISDINNSEENSNILEDSFSKCCIGHVDGTNIPIILNLEEALNHHIAILGVTGTGKTTLVTKMLIPEMARIPNHYTIIFDLTGEYEKTLNNYIDIMNIIENKYKEINKNADIYKDISNLEKLLDKYSKAEEDKEKINIINKQILSSIRIVINDYISSNDTNRLSIVKVNDIYNTNTTIDLFTYIFQVIFEEMKNNFFQNKKLTLILEEAHTIVPESNATAFSSSSKILQSIINKIGQIALQGRKYNIGLIVITQRTALVSKTILTQCNTIIVFKSFDKTSKDFLLSYMPENIINKIGSLKKQKAIVYGKAFNNNIPLICEIKEIE
ncbi:ATP-binding protein [Brachyspira pilosicoli]|uniref:ATP-binding protein n=1 Tax=Brachyspira pilosicoli TaxID=52584 RepID=UPI00242AC47B|nr:ATP-binding protein [Brachyspira pilosicoli]